MSTFTDTVQQDTPRLVVEYKREGKKDLFTWGVVGAIPLVKLVGCIVRVQAKIVGDSWIDECEPLALVIAWDDRAENFDVFCHPGIPEDSLVGMLEVVKATLLATHAARQAGAQQMILGPNGRPMSRG